MLGHICYFLSRLTDRLFAVAGAFLGLQIPQFLQQYTQRLSGHVESLLTLIGQLEQIARLSHKTLSAYIEKFKESGDVDFLRQADFMEQLVSRHEGLSEALQQMTQTPFWLHPYYFVKHFQSDIATSTFLSFEPGLVLTVEGGCYAVGGMLAAWTLFRLLMAFFILLCSALKSIFFKIFSPLKCYEH